MAASRRAEHGTRWAPVLATLPRLTAAEVGRILAATTLAPEVRMRLAGLAVQGDEGALVVVHGFRAQQAQQAPAPQGG